MKKASRSEMEVLEARIRRLEEDSAELKKRLVELRAAVTIQELKPKIAAADGPYWVIETQVGVVAPDVLLGIELRKASK